MYLVTAVITTHKRTPETVEKALVSVLSQTYPNIETIVVDDSPADYELRDAVAAVVEKYSNKNVKYIRHEKCMGACVARNTGLENANGEFIGFLDDDDMWLEEKIEKQIALFDSDDVAIVYCGHRVVLPNNESIDRLGLGIEGKVFHELLVVDNFIGSTSFPLLRTSALRQIGGFDPLMQASQDYDVWLRLASKYKVRCVKDVLVCYTRNQGECITSNVKKKIAGKERINLKLHDYLEKHKDAKWDRTIGMVCSYAADKRLGKALCFWFKAVCVCPLKIKDNCRILLKALKRFLRATFCNRGKK